MSKSRYSDRRTVLKTISAIAVGGTVATGATSARGTVESKINSNGHWAWFPLGQENWGRQKHPYDFREGDSRWMAEPASGGAVRMLANNIGGPGFFPNRNTGFDIHMGPIGDLNTISITSRTVQTQAGDDAKLFIGLYLDKNKNGEFFHWEKEKGDRERALPGPGGDDEGILFINAGGSYTIDQTTPFFILHAGTVATIEEITAGDLDGLDAGTPTALYIGVVDKELDGPEEAIIESVTIQKS